MNKVIIGLLALSTLGSGGWALYERGQNELAVKSAELAEARALEAEKLARIQQAIANELKKETEVAMARAMEASAKMEACCNKRK
ncbi:MAG: hypothetical protein JNN04_08815 [Cyclobacteriaceae bacterium]|nr:hypothetical protein [Cyclobacteriaceae bacterium]